MRPAQHVLRSFGVNLSWKATPRCWTGIRYLQTSSSGQATTRRSAENQASSRAVDYRRPSTGKRRNGLDLSLPPISKTSDMFDDLTKKAGDKGLYEAIAALDGRRIRLATMCSGIEAPMLAILEIQDSLIRSGRSALGIEHVFSAENRLFKQALIGCNFNPPTIFCDVVEVAKVINDPEPMATNAYGVKVAVPMDIDILIAGTSCVDFSGNNTNRKGIDDGGESGDTFHAVVTYCEASQPSIVIMENVVTADWSSMVPRFEAIGYSAMYVLVDTKDYYLPQTRQRGYMVCINNSKVGLSAAEAAVQRYATLMGELRRPASSPVSDFSKRGARPDVLKPRRQGKWDKEKIRHEEHRQKNRLGGKRPVTSQLLDHAYAPSIKRESERALDRIDMYQLGKAQPYNGAFDAMNKECIIDVSCSISRVPQTASHGIAPCITPTVRLFQTDRARTLSAENALELQGISSSRISFTIESPREKMDLAGNAMSSTVIGAAFLSTVIAGLPQLIAAIPITATNGNPPHSSSTWISGKRIEFQVQSNDLSTIDMKELLHKAEQTSRACYCESSDGISAHPLQKCIDCEETTCTDCGGNPEHNYALASRSRLSPKAFEQYVRSYLPVHLQLPSSLDDLLPKLKKTGFPDRYRHALHKAAQSIFSLQRIRRTQAGSTVVYSCASARLELVLGNGQAAWRVYVEPDKHLASNDKFRAFLKQPLLEANAITQFDSAYWQLRQPEERKVPMVVHGSGRRILSWWARLELLDYKDHRVREFLHIDITDDMLSAVLNGKYQYLPRCGMACESLYKRVDSEGPPIYLFLDPDPISPPEEDFFVFSYNKARLEQDEVRPIIARVATDWRPWSFEKECLEMQESSLEIDSVWKDMSNSWKLRAPMVPCSLTRVDDPLDLVEPNDCSHLVEVFRCTEPANLLEGRIPSDGFIKPIDDDFCNSNAWLFDTIRQQYSTNQWRTLSSHPGDFKDCSSCAPTPPASGDPVGAAVYDRAMHNRPQTTAVRITETSGQATLTLGVNFASLAHRVRSKLPENALNPQYDWRLLGDGGEQTTCEIQEFHLEKASETVKSDMVSNASLDVLPNQSRMLAWMKAQECGMDFDMEAIQDSVIKPSSLVIEVRARATVTVRGGIYATLRGSDKMTVSLALIQSELAHERNDLKEFKESSLTGFFATRATLIICPPSLFKHWLSEIKLRMTEGVVAIRITPDLSKFTVANFENASIIVVSQTVLSSEPYAKRLASFAAVAGPVTMSARDYSIWRKKVAERLPQSLSVFRRNGPDGLDLTKQHIKDTYQPSTNSEILRSNAPLPRYRGKKYVEAKERRELEAEITSDDSKKPEALNTEHVGKPLFEMFYFNRIIIDEGHRIEPRESASVVELNADKRWVLMSTLVLSDDHQASEMARLLGVTLPTGRKMTKELTFSERVTAGRDKVSDSHWSHMRRQCQNFLCKFARQSTIDSSDLIIQDHSPDSGYTTLGE